MTSARELVEKARLELIDLTRRNSLLNYRLLKARGFEMTCEDSAAVMSLLETEGSQLEVVPLNSYPTTKSKIKTLTSNHDAAVLKTRVRKTSSDARLHIEEKGTNVLFLAGGFVEWVDVEYSEEKSVAPLLICPIRIENSDAPYRLMPIEDGLVENISLREKLRQQNIELPPFELVTEGRIEEYLAGAISIVKSKGWAVDISKLSVSFFSFSKFQMYQDLDPTQWAELEDDQSQSGSILQSLLEDRIKEGNLNFDSNSELAADRAEEPTLVCDADRSQLRVVCLAREGKSFVVEGPPGTGKSQTITNLLADSLVQGKSVLFVAEKQTALSVVKRRLDEVGLGCLALELHSSNSNKRFIVDAIGEQLNALNPEERPFNEARYEECRAILDAYSDDLNTPLLNLDLTPQQIIGRTLKLTQSLQENIHNEELMLAVTTGAAEMLGEGSGITNDGLMAKLRVLSQFKQALSNLPIGERNPIQHSSVTVLTASEKLTIRSQAKEFSKELIELRESCTALEQIGSEGNSLTLNQIESGLRTNKLLLEDARLSHVGIERVNPEIAVTAVEKCLELLEIIEELKSYYSHAFEEAAWSLNAELLLEPLKRNRHSLFGSFNGEVRSVLRCLKQNSRNSNSIELEAAIGFLESVMQVEGIWAQIQIELTNVAGFDASVVQEMRVAPDFLKTCRDVLFQLSKVDGGFKGNVANPNRFAKLNADAITLIERLVKNVNGIAEELDRSMKRNYFGSGRARDLPLAELLLEIENLEATVEQLGQWIAYRASEEALLAVGLNYVPRLVNFLGPNTHLVDCVEFGIYDALSKIVFQERPRLVEWTGAQIEALRAEYIALEGVRKKACVYRVLEVNRSLVRNANSDELGVLHREMHKKRKLMPLRKMFSTCGSAILAVKPIFMMSPLSVASYFPRGMRKFDLVIFDEASQIRPADAFGAILRGRQLIVVGDTQQLPPTNFFETLWDDEQIEGEKSDGSDTDAPVADVESILALMRAMRAPATDLRMHYRSKHESLIAVSNAEFYRNRLLVCPNPHLPAEDSGLHHHLIRDAVYERGKSRTNPIEAQRIAQFAVDHMRRHPSQSLGVVAFSVAQQEAIEYAFDSIGGGRDVIEQCNSRNPNEPVFVRNLETVQGDERDVILISIGYGIDADGRLTMGFGPLSANGGDKRLNVLISRAKVKCHVFSNFSHDQIDTSKAAYAGVQKLKNYLKYAQTGVLDNPYDTGQEPDSPFEEHVGAVIRSLGFEIRYQVGTAGFRIDIGVLNPENRSEYLLGVECDGATYHGSRSARQRDKVRQLLLEQRGWKLYRIWSTDWFRSQQNEEIKLKRCLDEAVSRSDRGAYEH